MDDLRRRMSPGATAAHAATSASAVAGGGTGGGGARPAGGSGPGELLWRLRPNLVVCGFAAYAEDNWARVRVGPLAAEVLGSCPRCELLQVRMEGGGGGRREEGGGRREEGGGRRGREAGEGGQVEEQMERREGRREVGRRESGRKRGRRGKRFGAGLASGA